MLGVGSLTPDLPWPHAKKVHYPETWMEVKSLPQDCLGQVSSSLFLPVQGLKPTTLPLTCFEFLETQLSHKTHKMFSCWVFLITQRRLHRDHLNVASYPGTSAERTPYLSSSIDQAPYSRTHSVSSIQDADQLPYTLSHFKRVPYTQFLFQASLKGQDLFLTPWLAQTSINQDSRQTPYPYDLLREHLYGCLSHQWLFKR